MSLTSVVRLLMELAIWLESRGAAAVIQSTCLKAVYVHCAAHSLNLCVVAACNIQMVKNMMGTMVELCHFFSNSPKRQLELEKHINSIEGATAKSW